MLLRELFEAEAKRVVAVMPGGFHPFHPGHKSLYDWAVKTFGKTNVYVAATNDTKARPFPFEVKKELAAMAGVPGSNFIQVKSPFNNREYADLLDDNTALVFVRSQKDKSEQPLPDQTKKNGEPGYLRSYTGKDLNTADEMGYMAYGPTINFDFSGMEIKSASELRATWPEMSDEDKLKAAKLMYGNGAPVAVKLLDQALGVKDNEPVEEGLVGDGLKAAQLLKKAAQTGDENDALAAIKFGWSFIKNPMLRKLIVGVVKKFAQSQGMDWNQATAYIKQKTGVDVNNVKQQAPAPAAPAASPAPAPVGEDVSPEDEKKFHNELDDLVHKYFGDSPDEEKMKKKMMKVKPSKETNEILGFATKSPKRATIKKKRPPEEDSVQDKLKKRRAMAAKGDPNAYKSGSVKEGSPIEDLKKIVASKVYKKEYLMALKMMKQEAISAADAARRFMHVDARTLDAMAEKMGI